MSSIIDWFLLHNEPTKGLKAGSGVLAVDEDISRQHRTKPDSKLVGHSIPEKLQGAFNGVVMSGWRPFGNVIIDDVLA